MSNFPTSDLAVKIIALPILKQIIFKMAAIILIFSPNPATGQCPSPPPLIQNGGFENLVANCGTLSNNMIDAAFNQGCVNDWQAAFGTPSICFNSPSSGTAFACLGANTEAIFQALDICPGESYQVSFSTRAITGVGPATLDVYLANSLTAITGTSNPTGTMPIDPSWQSLGSVQVTYGSWQLTTWTFTINNPQNNQLLFVLQDDDFIPPVGIDAVTLACADPLPVDISIYDLANGNFYFEADMPSGLTGCWDFGDGTTSTGGNGINHTYAQPGEYTVCLTALCGCYATTCVNIDILPPQPLACPCTEANTLNIIASDQGTPYSLLEAFYDYDKNDDGIIDETEHNGCLAISGSLVVDQNLSITSCSNIRMQPCAEIVIQRNNTMNIYPSLELRGNTIYGCEVMWKGITVSANTRLIFHSNTIADAEYAVKAVGGSPYWLFPPPTRIDVRDNRFVKNHIGIYVQNNFNSGFVSHIPIEGNSFIGNLPLQTLLPPCNPLLPNYSAYYGYAGIATLFNDLMVGTPGTGTGISNTFYSLRNGIIGEYANLQIHHCEFNNIIGAWSFSGLGLPSFVNSHGIGVVGNGSTATVQDCRFNIVPHGVYGVNNYNLRIGRNDMPSVGTGIESFGTYNLRISDNLGISFSRAGIKCRELRTGLFVSEFITGNKFSGRTYPTGISYPVPFDFPAISIDNGISLQLPQARMSGNIAEYNQSYLKGITIRGAGNWTIDDNHISSTGVVDDAGFRLENSHNNRLHFNSVIQAAASNNTVGFDLKGSRDNLFCCNAADQTHYGHKFMGACNPNDLRHSTMDHHFYAIHCEAGTESGPQSDKGNMFTAMLSGTAFHGGTLIEIDHSRFRVLNNQPPHYPVFINAPNESPLNPWFIPNGTAPSCADESASMGICEPPGDVPPFQEQGNDERDITTAQGNGFSADAYGQMLLWEGQRRLYQRLKTYPELLGTHAVIDSFYAAASNGSIGADYEAEQAARDLYYHAQTLSESLRDISQEIDENTEAVTTKLSELAQVTTKADSSVIYHVADSLFMLGHEANMSLIAYLALADSIQKAKAQAALTLTNNLSAANVLQSNRKTLNRIYLETIGQGIVQLDSQQLAAISAIAHQCMLEGGNAVLDARVLYQLSEEKQFSDDTLCIPLEEREVKRVQNNRTDLGALRLMPNPVENIVAIAGLQAEFQQQVKVVLSNNTGQVYKALLLPDGATTFSVHDLPNGIFFCQILVNEKPAGIRKLIILH